MARDDEAVTGRFWELVEPLISEPDVEEGTVMHFPCLRSGGEFFAMPHHRSGDLVVKLPQERVAELIEEGVGEPFGPGEKVFKEWLLVPRAGEDRWLGLVGEARSFVNPGP